MPSSWRPTEIDRYLVEDLQVFISLFELRLDLLRLLYVSHAAMAMVSIPVITILELSSTGMTLPSRRRICAESTSRSSLVSFNLLNNSRS